MPRIIFSSRYLKTENGAHKANLVNYIATRDGVEFAGDTKGLLPATKKQEQLIVQIIAEFSDAQNMHEYRDYINKPIRKNASEFISQAIENNIDQIGNRKNYVDYIANRPRVEKIGAHGLFTDDGIPFVLSQVANEVSEHTGNVWTNIISLRREDAERFNFGNVAAWQDLIRAKRGDIAENMKIKPENLRWFASFHNESHHPHCHLIAYSANPKEGYLNELGIKKLRSAFARDIFEDDLIQIYVKQTERRDALFEQASQTVREMAAEMQSGVYENKAVEEQMLILTDRFQKTGGKKVYGYLKADVKAIINRIVDELAKDERVAKCYAAWYEMRNEVLHTYADKLPDPLPLSQQKELSRIRQIVIDEVINIGSHSFAFEPDDGADESIDETREGDDGVIAEPETMTDIMTGDEYDDEISAEESSGDHLGGCHAKWTGRYKQARRFLFGSGDSDPDFAQAYTLFMQEAGSGNALAMHDLGRMHKDGLGVETDGSAAQEWYAKALSAFLVVEGEKTSPYIEYRIGKLRYAGLGAPQDYETAAGWFGMAAEKNHKYAQYSLGGMYYRGQGVAQDYDEALKLYKKSAEQGNAYAAYKLAEMYCDGIGTAKDELSAGEFFKSAFAGFAVMEKKSKDDKLQYRIGQMLHTGTGTDQNTGEAVKYLEKSSKLGNINAQYMLAKIYLQTGGGHENVEKALEWLNKAAGSGNPPAQYTLGKLYLAGDHVEKDIHKAVTLLTQSAEQRNQYAQYALGKLFLAGDDIPRDITAAIKWLTASADQGNQYSQYALGKLYLSGDDVPQDKEQAAKWLLLSAAQGNEYAQFLLEHMGDPPSILLSVTRLMYQLGKIFVDSTKQTLRNGHHMDRKARRKEREKKIAQGHAYDDYAQEQNM